MAKEPLIPKYPPVAIAGASLALKLTKDFAVTHTTYDARVSLPEGRVAEG
jgi:hypothetical protein